MIWKSDRCGAPINKEQIKPHDSPLILAVKRHLIKFRFSIHDKNSHQSEIAGTYLNIIEVICDTLNQDKTK